MFRSSDHSHLLKQLQHGPPHQVLPDVLHAVQYCMQVSSILLVEEALLHAKRPDAVCDCIGGMVLEGF